MNLKKEAEETAAFYYRNRPPESDLADDIKIIARRFAEHAIAVFIEQHRGAMGSTAAWNAVRAAEKIEVLP